MQFQHGTNLGYAQGVDPLGTLAGGSSANPSATLKALHNYQAIAVVGPEASGTTTRMWCASVGDATSSSLNTQGLGVLSYAAPALDYNFLVTATRWQGYKALIACNINAGDAFYCQAWFAGAVTPSAVRVYGLLTNPGLITRPDGRGYPVGGLQGQYSQASGATVIAAPATPLRIFIKSMDFAGAAGGGAGCVLYTVNGTVSGSAVSVGSGAVQTSATGTAGAGAAMGFFDYGASGGLLLDQNTSVTFSKLTIGTAPSQEQSAGLILYDLIV